MKINWREVPKEVRSAAEPFVKRWSSLAPSWCESLNLRYDGSEPALASTLTDAEYRQCTLCFGGGFLNQPDDIENVIIHELLHIAFEPVRDVYRDATAMLGEEAQILAQEGFRRAMEGTLCDITAGIQRSIKF